MPLTPGMLVFDPDQTLEDAAETEAYLSAHLWLIEPDGTVEGQRHYDHVRLHAPCN